ncbi:MAG: S26 family signal peptidase [Planctomycetota bacterium]
MMARIQSLIFYAAAMALLLLAYHVATSFAFAIVDEGYRYMEPALQARETLLLDTRRSTITELKTDDLIAYRTIYRSKPMRMFGRVAALPGMTISVRKERLIVEGADVAPAGKDLDVLRTGLMVPRETVFVVFDSPLGQRVSLPQRLVPYRNIIGRMAGK